MTIIIDQFVVVKNKHCAYYNIVMYMTRYFFFSCYHNNTKISNNEVYFFRSESEGTSDSFNIKVTELDSTHSSRLVLVKCWRISISTCLISSFKAYLILFLIKK